MKNRKIKPKRSEATIATRKVKADFIRWARRNDTPAWVHKGAVYWVADSMPSALHATGAAL